MEDERLISLLESMEGRLKSLEGIEGRLKSLEGIEGRLKSLEGIEDRLKALEGMEGRLKAELQTEIGAERVFLSTALDRIEGNLDRKISGLRGEMQQMESRMNRRFDQINVRLQRMDVVWKAAREWGREADEIDSGRDRLIADLRHDLTDLQQRLSVLEQKQQQ